MPFQVCLPPVGGCGSYCVFVDWFSNYLHPVPSPISSTGEEGSPFSIRKIWKLNVFRKGGIADRDRNVVYAFWLGFAKRLEVEHNMAERTVKKELDGQTDLSNCTITVHWTLHTRQNSPQWPELFLMALQYNSELFEQLYPGGSDVHQRLRDILPVFVYGQIGAAAKNISILFHIFGLDNSSRAGQIHASYVY